MPLQEQKATPYQMSIFIGIHSYSSGIFSIICTTKRTIYFGEGAIHSPQRRNTTSTINIISKIPFVSCFTFCFLMSNYEEHVDIYGYCCQLQRIIIITVIIKLANVIVLHVSLYTEALQISLLLNNPLPLKHSQNGKPPHRCRLR